jgi:hypothetical protein
MNLWPDSFQFTGRSWLGLAICLFLASPFGLAAEQIRHLAVDVEIETSGELLVREKIHLAALPRNSLLKKHRLGVRRGIEVSSSKPGFVTATLLEVLRNGQPDAALDFLDPRGFSIPLEASAEETTYEISYRISHCVKLGMDSDQLFINATGHNWPVAIGGASFRVTLPPAAEILDYIAHTGPPGSLEESWNEVQTGGGILAIETSRPLSSGEGLVVSVEWEPGMVDVSPSSRPGAGGWVSQVLAWEWLLFFSGVFLAGACWFAFSGAGREAPIGAVFCAPEGWDPASCRFLVTRGAVDEKSLMAILIQLGEAGILTLERNPGSSSWALKHTGKKWENLDPNMEAVASALFSRGSLVSLEQGNRGLLVAALKVLKANIRRTLQSRFFQKNGGWWIAVSLLLLSSSVFAILRFAPRSEVLWLCAGLVAVSWLAMAAAKRLAAGVLRDSIRPIISGGLLLGISVPVLWYFASVLTHVFPESTLVMLVVSTLLIRWSLRFWISPTSAGWMIYRRLRAYQRTLATGGNLDHVVSEREEWQTHLPYAVALNEKGPWICSLALNPGGESRLSLSWLRPPVHSPDELLSALKVAQDSLNRSLGRLWD